MGLPLKAQKRIVEGWYGLLLIPSIFTFSKGKSLYNRDKVGELIEKTDKVME
jgi:hypothetical protein